MHIELITHTPEPEKLISAAARLCYSSKNIKELKESITSEKIQSFVKMLATLGHESPLEHITFTFGIEGVSRSFLAQITRHRIASYSVQSQRYVAEKNFEYIIPPEISAIPEAEREFIKAMETAQKSYNKLTSILKNIHKEKYISSGIDEKNSEKKAQKKAIEDARFVLPNACETKLICTFNARSLLNFFSLRCCNRAQWEIRNVAIEMLKLVKKVAPNVFFNAGPNCVSGNCREGKMSCGEMPLVKKFFTNL